MHFLHIKLSTIPTYYHLINLFNLTNNFIHPIGCPIARLANHKVAGIVPLIDYKLCSGSLVSFLTPTDLVLFGSFLFLISIFA